MSEAFPDEVLKKLEASRVVAGFSIEKPEHAVPLVNALLEGGINAIELTLRTAAGMEALRAICAAKTGMLVGVGTILTGEQAREVQAAGADFGVAPGMNTKVIAAAREVSLPFAPGVVTPSEVEASIELGCKFMKFFPAEVSGGLNYLKSMAAAYRHLGVKVFPLGGVNGENMLDYLRCPDVASIGGSWIVKGDLLEKEDWTAIAKRAADVVKAVEVGLS